MGTRPCSRHTAGIISGIKIGDIVGTFRVWLAVNERASNDAWLATGHFVHGNEQMWVAVQRELREVVWLASVVFVLSVAGVAIAVAFALA